MTPILATRPWEIIGLDIVGPHTLENGERKYFIIAVDYFSKWVEILPVKDITTQEVIRVINQDLFWKREIPEKIITDAGTQFTSKEFTEFTDSRKIITQTAAPHHQQANGQAESAVKIFKQQLAILLQGEIKFAWKEALKKVASNMNHSVNTTTGLSPYNILHGQEPNSHFDNMMRKRNQQICKNKELAEQNSVKKKTKEIQRYNQGKRIRQFTEGMWILMKNNYRTKWTQPRWTGPFKIIEVTDIDTYRVRTEEGRESIINTQNIKKYKGEIDNKSSKLLPDKSTITQSTLNTPLVKEAPPTMRRDQMPKSPKNTTMSSPVKDTIKSSPERKDSDLVGKRIKVYWPQQGKHYTGTVEGRGLRKGTWDVRYDDEKDQEPIAEKLHGPRKVKWELLEENSDEEQGQDTIEEQEEVDHNTEGSNQEDVL
jgi:hypothetical protein